MIINPQQKTNKKNKNDFFDKIKRESWNKQRKSDHQWQFKGIYFKT